MSTRSSKRPTVRQLPSMLGAKPTWRVLPVVSKTPDKFAQELEEKLNLLMEGGWTLTGMMERDDALYLTGQKLQPVEVQAPTAQIALPGAAVGNREEVLYNYLEEQENRQAVYPDLNSALVAVSRDMECDRVLPISITVMKVQTYDAMDFTRLNKALVRTGS